MEVYVTSRYVINTYNSVIALLARPSNTGCVSYGKERFISSWWSIIHHKWLDFEMVSTSLQVVESGSLTVSRYRWAKLYFPSNSSSGASTNVANYAQIGNCICSKTSSWSYNGLTSWVEPRLVSVFCTKKSNIHDINHGALWLRWLKRLSSKQEILGSNPSSTCKSAIWINYFLLVVVNLQSIYHRISFNFNKMSTSHSNLSFILGRAGKSIMQSSHCLAELSFTSCHCINVF